MVPDSFKDLRGRMGRGREPQADSPLSAGLDPMTGDHNPEIMTLSPNQESHS